ncbi:ABC1 kinase family protein [Gordonia rubripertincta]|uniref:AarF/ABC1/UbiB kinase family protein n=1 Tax=Gordonia rubripertincta TaxID=36822 RepID=A0ABT4N3P3_GORRU|nr:AarF/ABC1/UbiB kinase family protein [Gordonia rubripertincta]MCZ4553888.1 AarF/ABC1/UbiB kinase family protein [Gordonia rubripertincta]
MSADDELPASQLRRGGELGKVAAHSAMRRVRSRAATLGGSHDERRLRAEQDALAAAEELITVLGSMKGAAMKVGQFLSLLDLDMVPRSARGAFNQKLAILRDNAPHVPNATMLGVLEDELGPKMSEFTDIDPEPIAAASIGQVYRATLTDGRAVAVKVQYPGIDRVVRADLKNLAIALRLYKKLLPTVDPQSFVREITGNILAELDYEAEADNQRRLSIRYAGHPFIQIPEVIEGLCTTKVLTTELITGIGLAEVAGLDAETRDQVGEVIYRFYCGSIHTDATFCGDPHPGNVILADDGRVAFLDFGSSKTMSKGSLKLEQQSLIAARAGDATAVASVLRRGGVLVNEESITDEDVLDYVRDSTWWHMNDEPLTITPQIANTAMIAAVHPATDYGGHAREQRFPEEHLMARRVEFYTCAMLGQLGATANWYRIEGEWLTAAEPETELGQIDQWWRRRTFSD